MATWRCLHRRTSPLANSRFPELADWPTSALLTGLDSSSIFPGHLIVAEVEQRRLKCPACESQDRRLRHGWAALFVVACLLLFVCWRSC